MEVHSFFVEVRMDFLNVMMMNFRVWGVKTRMAVARLSKKLGL